MRRALIAVAVGGLLILSACAGGHFYGAADAGPTTTAGKSHLVQEPASSWARASAP